MFLKAESGERKAEQQQAKRAGFGFPAGAPPFHFPLSAFRL